MRHTIVHDLTPDALHRTLDAALAFYGAHYPAARARLQWLSADHAEIHCHVGDTPLKAALVLQPQGLLVKVDLPLLMKPFKDRVIRRLDSEARAWISRAHAGQL